MLHFQSSAKSQDISETFNLHYKAGYDPVFLC